MEFLVTGNFFPQKAVAEPSCWFCSAPSPRFWHQVGWSGLGREKTGCEREWASEIKQERSEAELEGERREGEHFALVLRTCGTFWLSGLGEVVLGRTVLPSFPELNILVGKSRFSLGPPPSAQHTDHQHTFLTPGLLSAIPNFVFLSVQTPKLLA